MVPETEDPVVPIYVAHERTPVRYTDSTHFRDHVYERVSDRGKEFNAALRCGGCNERDKGQSDANS